MAKEFNHGIRLVDAGNEPRSLETYDQTSIGAVVTAPDADKDLYPYDTPVVIYTHEIDKITRLGPAGTALDVVYAVRAQGIEGKLVIVRVEEKSTPEETRAAIIGSSVSMTGVHALSYARGHTGVEPGILNCPRLRQRPG